MEITLIIQALMGLGSLIGVYVSLNNKIIKLESQVENNRKNIDKIDSDRREIAEELKQIKELIIEMKIELAVQKQKTN
jgi:wobble nucleotide-excising tRNase